MSLSIYLSIYSGFIEVFLLSGESERESLCVVLCCSGCACVCGSVWPVYIEERRLGTRVQTMGT